MKITVCSMEGDMSTVCSMEGDISKNLQQINYEISLLKTQYSSMLYKRIILGYLSIFDSVLSLETNCK